MKDNFIRDFKNKVNFDLTEQNFLDIDLTINLRKKSYIQIIDIIKDNKSLKSFENVLNELEKLQKTTLPFYENEIVLFHDKDCEIGAIKMKLKNFWNVYTEILDFLDVKNTYDLFVVDINFKFGFCIEPTEYEYLKTTWVYKNQ